MATEIALSSWETDFSSLSKSLQTLFHALATQASGTAELNEKVRKLNEQNAMWRDSFAEEHAQKEEMKVEQRELVKQLATLTERNAQLEKENAHLQAENLQLTADYDTQLKQNLTLRYSDVTNSFSIVLIDGDGLIFDDSLLMRGQDGGRDAAQILRKSVQEHLGSQGADVNIRVHVFLNKLGLARVLQEANIVNADTFDQFVMRGFQSAHSSTAVIDVGSGKEAADAKIRDELSFCVSMPQCKLLILGGSHDNGYSTVLRSLKTEGRLEKVCILKGYRTLAQELQEFKDRVMEIDGLFRLAKINTSPRVSVMDSPKVLNSVGSKVSDAMTFSAIAKSGAATAASPVDNQLAGFKLVSSRSSQQERCNAVKVKSVRELQPRPCHAKYLRDGCTTYDCPYGHTYVFSKEQTAELGQLAKKLPCEGWLNDSCYYTAEGCIYGHVCSMGSSCTRGSKCFFKKWHAEVAKPV